MKINIKELCKHIKKSRHNMIWTLEGGIHYITNRHWAVKYTELPREVLIALFSVFAKQPSEGKSLVMTMWGDADENLVSLVQVFKDAEGNSTKGEITNIILDHGDRSFRVVKTQDYIVRINNSYMTLISGEDHGACSGRQKPVSFCENQLILLPIRTENPEEDETIIELLAG